MNSWAIWGIPSAAIFTIAMLGLASTNLSNVDAAMSGESVTVTIAYPKFTLKSGEVVVLLDVTNTATPPPSTATLSVVHVAANLPCDGSTAIPDVSIIAGVAGGTLTPIISSAATFTSFIGPSGTCVYHVTATPGGAGGTVAVGGPITDVILGSNGLSRAVIPAGTTITITGTYT